MTIHVVASREGVSLGELSSSGPEPRLDSSNEWFTFDAYDVGDTVLDTYLICAGRIIGWNQLSHHVYATLAVERFPQNCGVFDPLDSDSSPTMFQCDYSVIDSRGLVVGGYTHGEAHVIHFDGGFARWVRTDGGMLVYERNAIAFEAVAFNPTPAWPADASSFEGDFRWQGAADFAVSATQLAIAGDGGVSVSSFDAGVYNSVICRTESLFGGEAYTRCYVGYHAAAAASDGERRSIVYRPTSATITDKVNYSPYELFFVCPLQLGEQPSLGACLEKRGIILRQQRHHDNLVLVQRIRDIYWVDLLTGDETFVRTLRPEEQPNEAPSREQQGNFPAWPEKQYTHGFTGYFARAPNLEIVVPVLPDRDPDETWLPMSDEEARGLQPNEWFESRASSDFVWGVDLRNPGGGMYWAPLP